MDASDPIPFTIVGPKFPLGRLTITANAKEQLRDEDVKKSLLRHIQGDWGDLEKEDQRANEQAVADGGRLVSAYHSIANVKFYIITEADRSFTTILLAEDY